MNSNKNNVEKITFASVFKQLFTNTEKLENNIPGYKEWEKAKKQKERENKNDKR